MTNRYLDITNDVAFKKVFSDKEIMKDFLNGILHLEEGCLITEIEFIPTEEIPDLGQGKKSIFDLKCKDQEGNIFVVEMQNQRQSYFLNRMQFYACHTYVSQLKRGLNHEGLMPVILIAITKENIFPEDISYVSCHKTKEDKTNKQHLFALTYVFIELSKFNKTEEELKTTEDHWLYLLAKSEEKKQPPVNTEDENILKAYEALERFNWNEVEYDAYIRARLLREAEEITLREKLEELQDKLKGAEDKLKGAEDKLKGAESRGREEGERDKAVEIAKKMLSKGQDIELISELTGLSIDEIRK